MVAKKLEPSTRLRVSEDCCLYYLEKQSTRMPVAEIAAAVGISERTFYRYFTVKADSVEPIFDHMTETMNVTVIAGPAADLRRLMIDAFETMFTSRITSRAAEFFPLIFADPEIWALFLRKVQEGETSLAPLVAASLGLPADDNRARAAAAAVASSTRIALERLTSHGADLSIEFTGLLDAFGQRILLPHGSQPDAHTLNLPASPPG
jgi:AcrR family transcriptional regulator